MIEPGDTPPTFTATLGTSDHELFDLDGHLGDGPVVLAFFPGAFREEHGVEFGLVSDTAGEAVGAYDLEIDIDIEPLGLYGVANRAALVLD
jgi:peroxiredoxin